LDCSDISRQSIQKVFKLKDLPNLQITSLSSALSVEFVEKCIRSLPKLETLQLRYDMFYLFVRDSFRSAEIRYHGNNGTSSTDEISLPRMSEGGKIKVYSNRPIDNFNLLKRLQYSF
jgi:hypothetical protein